MEIWELEAREQIRDTVARYAHCVDDGRFDDLVALFTPDGVLEVEGEPAHRGRDATGPSSPAPVATSPRAPALPGSGTTSATC
jgi:SnoaL-like protein